MYFSPRPKLAYFSANANLQLAFYYAVRLLVVMSPAGHRLTQQFVCKKAAAIVCSDPALGFEAPSGQRRLSAAG